MNDITIIEDSPIVVAIRRLSKRVKHQINFIPLLRAVYDSNTKNKIQFCLVDNEYQPDILLRSDEDLIDFTYQLFKDFSIIDKDEFSSTVRLGHMPHAAYEELVNLAQLARSAAFNNKHTLLTGPLHPGFDKVTKGILIDFSRSLNDSANNIRPSVLKEK